MIAAPPTGDDGWLARLVQTAGAAIFGALVSLVAFRTRLALMDNEIKELKKELQKQRDDTERRHHENRELWTKYMADVGRRQSMMLEVVASIARKVGADQRFSDALVRYLDETKYSKYPTEESET